MAQQRPADLAGQLDDPPPQQAKPLADQLSDFDKAQGADLNSQLIEAPPQEGPPAPATKDWHVSSIGQAFVEDLLNAPAGSAFDVAAATPGKTTNRRLLDAFQFTFPNLGIDLQGFGGSKLKAGRLPTAEELGHFSEQNDRFKPVWGALRKAQQDSIVNAATMGPKPDWDAAMAAHLSDAYDEVRARRAAGEKPGQGEFLPDPRNTEDMNRYAFNTAIPGKDRPPLTDQEIAQVGWDVIKAQNQQDLDNLPLWIRGLARGTATGLKFAAVPGSGFTAGAAFEAVNQALGVASGRQQEFNPEAIVKSGLTMKAAQGLGEVGARLVPQIPKTASTVGTLAGFEAAAGIERALAPKPRMTTKEPDEHGGLEKFVAHVVETAATLGIAGFVKGLGEKPPEGSLGHYDATYLTAKAMGKKIDERIPNLEEHVKERMADVDAEMTHAEQRLTRLIKNAFPGDKKAQDAAEVAARVVVESQGRLAPPEGFKAPEEWQDILDATKAVGAAGRGYGRLMHEAKRADGTPWLPWARYETPGTGEVVVQRKGDPEPTESAKLVGGLKYAEEKGFYFPQSNEAPGGEEAPVPSAATGGSRKGKAPLPQGGLAAGHLQKRQMEFDQAYQERPLDLSLRKAMEVYSAEGEALRRYYYLDHARATGLLLTTDQLPDAKVRAEMGLQEQRLKQDIKALSKDIQNFPVEDRRAVRQQLYAKQAELAAVKLAAKEKLYNQLSGPEWADSPFKDMWLHKDALDQFKRTYGEASTFSYIYQSLRGMARAFRVSWDPSQYLRDFVGDWQTYSRSGIKRIASEVFRAQLVNIGVKHGDKLDATWDSLVKGEAFGGSANFSAADTGRIRRITAKIADNIREGKGAKGLKLARLLEQRGQLVEQANAWVDSLPPGLNELGYLGISIPLNVMNAVPKFRQALVDQAFARAAFRSAVQYGVMDSGPMTPQDAFNYVAHIANFRTLSRGVQNAAKFADFVRWPSMQAHSTITRNGIQRPSLLGIPIPTPLDTIIRTDPESPQAKAALTARGLLRIGTSVGQMVGLGAALQSTMLNHLGVSQASFDEKMKAKYDYLPSPLAWLMGKSYIPLWRNKLGELEGFDLGSMIPELAAMRYFSLPVRSSELWKNPSKAAGDILSWALNKNMFAGTAEQVLTKKDFKGETVGEGFGPGKRFWPLLTFFMPPVPVHMAEEYFRQQNLPPQERNALRDFIMRSLVGVPITIVQDKGKLDVEINRLVDEGAIAKVTNQQTGQDRYEVVRPLTAEGKWAQFVLKQREDLYGTSPASIIKRIYYRSQARMEAAGLK